MRHITEIEKANYQASLDEWNRTLGLAKPLAPGRLEEIKQDVARLNRVDYYEPGKAIYLAVNYLQELVQALNAVETGDGV